MKYTVVLTKDEDGFFNVVVPTLPGCFTWGKTRRQALDRAVEAIESYIESLIIDGEVVPVEDSSQTVVVNP